METSVQINFNNKIITLHNVTIVKNPKIISINARQYEDFIKATTNKFNSSSSIQLQKPPVLSLHQRSTLLALPPPPPPLIPLPPLVPVSPASPPRVRKAPSPLASPAAKKKCSNLDFHCIFCSEVHTNPESLVQHMHDKHPTSVKLPPKIEPDEEIKLEPVCPVINQLNDSHQTTNSVGEEEEQSEIEDEENEQENEQEQEREQEQDQKQEESMSEDENSENDLVMDFEESQSSSLYTRSSTPPSPEFEEHIPLSTIKEEPENWEANELDEINSESTKKQSDQSDEQEEDDDDMDFNDFEYSTIMEPICELNYDGEDSMNGYEDPSQNNEAMMLYRKAMELNYENNGIKKRGRRKTVAKPLKDNTGSLNGILAGLLESPSIKLPQGPGRGRRREMNEQEMDIVNSGVCFFQCTVCDKSYKFAGDLAKHVRSHTISSPYQCSICLRKFTHIGSLNTHLRIHSGERPYKCINCDKSFTQSNSLMVHVKSHLSSKPFQCDLCNKGFQNATSLQIHQKTHTVPTSYPCPQCFKEFRDQTLLEDHMAIHQQSMLYQCSLCSHQFEQACLLVQHIKEHTGDKPFQCSLCEKSFTQPGSLNTHLRIHTGEKPFSCEICNKSFTQASSLSVHMKVHGEKEFRCEFDQCNKSYSQESYLKKHMQKHIETQNDENNQLQL